MPGTDAVDCIVREILGDEFRIYRSLTRNSAAIKAHAAHDCGSAPNYYILVNVARSLHNYFREFGKQLFLPVWREAFRILLEKLKILTISVKPNGKYIDTWVYRWNEIVTVKIRSCSRWPSFIRSLWRGSLAAIFIR